MAYLGTQPNDVKKNTGLYTPSEILQLTKEGSWGGSLELIEEQTASSSSALDFTNLGNYDVHYMTLDNFQCTTSTTRYVAARVSNDGGSSYESSNYERAWFRINTSGTTAEISDTGQSEMSNFFSIDSDNRTSQSYIYFFNLLNSSKFSSATFHSFNSVGDYIYFGGFNYAVAETNNALRIFPDGDALATGNAKLYGVKQI